jgi:hypothetical protein
LFIINLSTKGQVEGGNESDMCIASSVRNIIHSWM